MIDCIHKLWASGTERITDLSNVIIFQSYFVIALALMTIGCSREFRVTFTGVVSDAATSTPLADVKVKLDAIGGSEGTVSTDTDGRFSIHLSIPETQFIDQSPIWTLHFSKPGFEDGLLEIDPTDGHHDPSSVDVVAVIAVLKKQLKDKPQGAS